MIRRRSVRLCAFGAALLLSAVDAAAQGELGDPGYRSGADAAMHVAIAFRMGAVASTPRGTFPSVIIGESRRPSGAIGQEHGRTALGPSFGLQILIPFSETIGATLAVGSSVLTADYSGDTGRGALRFELQTLDVGIGVEWSVLSFPRSFGYGGLRSVYLVGEVGLAPAVLANRLEGPYSADTSTAAVTGVGSFTSEEPFRVGVSLAGGAGLRFAATRELELIAEARYAYALNPVFSSDAIADNEFTLDRFTVVAGVAWRF